MGGVLSISSHPSSSLHGDRGPEAPSKGSTKGWVGTQWWGTPPDFWALRRRGGDYAQLVGRDLSLRTCGRWELVKGGALSPLELEPAQNGLMFFSERDGST